MLPSSGRRERKRVGLGKWRGKNGESLGGSGSHCYLVRGLRRGILVARESVAMARQNAI